jgi:hypothetical protein
VRLAAIALGTLCLVACRQGGNHAFNEACTTDEQCDTGLCDQSRCVAPAPPTPGKAVAFGGHCGDGTKTGACAEGVVCVRGRCKSCLTSADCTNGVECREHRCAPRVLPPEPIAQPPLRTPTTVELQPGETTTPGPLPK